MLTDAFSFVWAGEGYHILPPSLYSSLPAPPRAPPPLLSLPPHAPPAASPPPQNQRRRARGREHRRPWDHGTAGGLRDLGEHDDRSADFGGRQPFSSRVQVWGREGEEWAGFDAPTLRYAMEIVRAARLHVRPPPLQGPPPKLLLPGRHYHTSAGYLMRDAGG